MGTSVNAPEPPGWRCSHFARITHPSSSLRDLSSTIGVPRGMPWKAWYEDDFFRGVSRGVRGETIEGCCEDRRGGAARSE